LRLVGCGQQQMFETNGVVPAVGGHANRALNRLQRFGRKRN
jgi:hypothetical protein